MGYNTAIQYCDSTLNLQMGCDGCELWERSIRTCYAGQMHDQYAGNENFPDSFSKPKIFPERAKYITEWSDLTYRENDKKPWLSGMPRIIFLNDMGDTFTRELSLHWLDPFIPMMEESPHIYLMLTKRPTRMRTFWHEYGSVPDNIWLGTSITRNVSLSRVDELCEIDAKTRFVSAEPLLESVILKDYMDCLRWVIVGGESGIGSRKTSPLWMRVLVDDAQSAGVPLFVKQMGGVQNKRGALQDMPSDLRVRQMPAWEHLTWKGKTPPKAFQVSLF